MYIVSVVHSNDASVALGVGPHDPNGTSGTGVFIPPAPVERGISVDITGAGGVQTPLRWSFDVPDANTVNVFMKDDKNLNGTYESYLFL